MTMDSDSESQDSDDGRRFRFEATRKDDAAQRRKLQASSSKSSKHKTRYTDDLGTLKRDGNHKESRDKQNDCDRSSKVKEDCKRFAKHSKHSHESRWHSKKRSRDKSRDSRRYRDRDRLRKDRSRDRDNDDKSPIDKQKNRSRERYRHHSRNRNRDTSHQCNKLKLLDSGKSQDELVKSDSFKKSCEKDTKITCSKNHSNDDSNQIIQVDSSLDDQGCKQIDLSDFDVLSETHETSSNASDVANQDTISQCEESKVTGCDKNELYLKKQNLEQCYKVNVKIDDRLSGSSNNNSSAISDPTSSVLEQNTEHENAKDREDGICKKTHFPGLMSVVKDEESFLEPDDFVYGPSLPPALKNHSNSSDDINASCNNIGSNKLFIGPSLPRNKKENVSSDSTNDPSSSDKNCELNSTDDQYSTENTEGAVEDATFGPVLPPHLQQNKSENISQDKLIGPIGPLSPSSGSMKKDELVQNHSESDDDDDDGIGPLPSNHPALRNNIVHEQLERRAVGILNEFKEEIEGDTSKREEWMMELPPSQVADLGLGPRKFRMRPGPDMSDRSCWTDTPAMKAKKEKEKAEKKMICCKELDGISVRESTKEEKKSSKKREKSLLELHQEKLAKKRKKEEKELGPEKPTRRPFDRDVDLQANRFDQIQKKAILKKAQMLNDRFCKGKI